MKQWKGQGMVQICIAGTDKSSTRALNLQLVGISEGGAQIAWKIEDIRSGD